MIKEVALADVRAELTGTRKTLERVPDERFGWSPHARSFNLGELSTHLVNSLHWAEAILGHDEFDMAESPFPREPLKTRAALLNEFDRRETRVLEALDEVSDKELRADWVLRNGTQVVSRLPRVAALRLFVVSHMIHHRAQLGVYLRLLGQPVPGVYGPSADETGERD